MNDNLKIIKKNDIELISIKKNMLENGKMEYLKVRNFLN